jgi:hypothetical protein
VSEDRRVDALRQQLRSLGYLDAGVDRFVLAPAVRRRRPAVIALLASIRSGIVAALLLGPAAAIGLAARLPGLVTGVRDGIVIAIYLAVLFGAAVAVLSFAAALAVSFVARSSPQRGRALSTAAGGIASMACLAYLTLWWRTANAGFGWQAPEWTAFALVVAVAISLLVGHVITLTARAVVVARTSVDRQQPPGPGASWRIAVVAGLIAFVGAAVLLVLTTESPRGEGPVQLAVRSTGVRVLVVAIDGFDLNLSRRWHSNGAVTALLPLFPIIESGLSVKGGTATRRPGARDSVGRGTVHVPTVARFAPVDSRDPARLWTTIATGRSPDAHGVEQLETRRVAGMQGRLTSAPVTRVLAGATDLLRLTRPAIASNVERQVKTFWEVAAQAGLRTSVVNWWATWPADASAGTVISDRAILRLERGGELDAEIAPVALYDFLTERWPELRARAIDEASGFFAFRALHDLPPLREDLRKIVTRSAELDGMVAKMAEATADEMDLIVLYLPGLDIVQHTLFGSEPPRPSEVDQRLTALRQYYNYLGTLVAATIARLHREGVVFLVAQPGRLQQGHGVLEATGPHIQPSQTTATVLDVAPTVLHALGIPVEKNLEGRVIDALFQPQFLATHPVRFVDSYGRRGVTAGRRSGEPLDEEMIERLRSLGYVR